MSAPARPLRLRALAAAAPGVAAALGLALAAASLAEEPPDLESLRRAFARPASVPFPPESGWSEPRQALGRALFFDPRLSGSNRLACATCHNPALSFEDALPRALGPALRPGARATPTVRNLAWAPRLFWDGRAPSLEALAGEHLASPDAMDQPLETLGPELSAIDGYRPLFEAAYPGEGIGLPTVSRALATYLRTLVSGPAAFDAFAEGDDTALRDDQRAGLLLFGGKAGCAGCHSGWRFTDDGFHDVGVPSDDPGRAAVAPDEAGGEHAFKTPTLREVARRAPYMHDGSQATLLDVVELYDRGGRAGADGTPTRAPLGLTAAEKAQLLAFLESLTGEGPPATLPILPR